MLQDNRKPCYRKHQTISDIVLGETSYIGGTAKEVLPLRPKRTCFCIIEGTQETFLYAKSERRSTMITYAILDRCR